MAGLTARFIAKQQHPNTDIQFRYGFARNPERVRAERNPRADLWWGAAHTTFRRPLTKTFWRRILLPG